MRPHDVIVSLEQHIADALPSDIHRSDLARFAERLRRGCVEHDPEFTPYCLELRDLVAERARVLAAAAEAARMGFPQLADEFVRHSDSLSRHRLIGDDALGALTRWLGGLRERTRRDAWETLNAALEGLRFYRESGRLTGEMEMYLRRVRADELARLLAAVAEHVREGETALGFQGAAVRAFLLDYLAPGTPDPTDLDELYAFERDHRWLLLVEPEVRALARLRIGAATFDESVANPMPGGDLVTEAANLAAAQLAATYAGRPSQVRELGGAGAEQELEDERSKRRLRRVREAADLRRPRRDVLVVAYVKLEGERRDAWGRVTEEAAPVGKAFTWASEIKPGDEARAEAELKSLKAYGRVLKLPDTPDVLARAREQIVEEYRTAVAAETANSTRTRAHTGQPKALALRDLIVAAYRQPGPRNAAIDYVRRYADTLGETLHVDLEAVVLREIALLDDVLAFDRRTHHLVAKDPAEATRLHERIEARIQQALQEDLLLGKAALEIAKLVDCNPFDDEVGVDPLELATITYGTNATSQQLKALIRGLERRRLLRRKGRRYFAAAPQLADAEIARLLARVLHEHHRKEMPVSELARTEALALRGLHGTTAQLRLEALKTETPVRLSFLAGVPRIVLVDGHADP